MKLIHKQALRNSLLTSLYIIGVGSFMFVSAQLKVGQSNSFIVPIALLLLFVLSASITGYFIFGKPILLYLDNQKKEAYRLLQFTLIYLSTFTIFALILLIIFTRK